MLILIDNKSGLPIYDQIYTQIKAQIISDNLHADDPLPSIRSLAKDLRISVITTKRAYDELEKEGFIYTVTKVLGVAIPDEPGGLNRVLHVLSGSGVNIEYMYAFLGGKAAAHATMIFHVQDPAAAVAALDKACISCITQEDLSSL